MEYTVQFNEAYVEGFRKVAEAYGVDAEALVKAAGQIASAPSEEYVAGFRKAAEAHGIDPDALLKEAQWWRTLLGIGGAAARRAKEVKQVATRARGAKGVEDVTRAAYEAVAAGKPIRATLKAKELLGQADEYANLGWMKRFANRFVHSKEDIKLFEEYRKYRAAKAHFNKLRAAAREGGVNISRKGRVIPARPAQAAGVPPVAPVTTPATAATTPASNVTAPATAATTPAVTPEQVSSTPVTGAPAQSVADAARSVSETAAGAAGEAKKSLGSRIYNRLSSIAKDHPVATAYGGGLASGILGTKFLGGGGGVSAEQLEQILSQYSGNGPRTIVLPPQMGYAGAPNTWGTWY